MMRSTGALATFRNCMEIIEYILDYVEKHEPGFAACLRNFSFMMTVELLHSAEKYQAVGALHYLSISVAKPKNAQLFSTFALQIINGVFSIMNQLNCKFNLTIQKKSHELAKTVLKLYRERCTEDTKMARLKALTQVLVRIVPNNKQYEQKILFNLMMTAFEGLSKKQVYEIMLDDCYVEKLEERKITIEEILNGERFREQSPPLHLILDYIFSTLRHYKTLLERKRTPGYSGTFKDLSYDDCSSITSAVIAATNILKFRFSFKFTDEPQGPDGTPKGFEARIEELIEIMRDLLKENEDFNDKKMQSRGSSVRPSPKETVPNALGTPSVSQNGLNGPNNHALIPNAVGPELNQEGPGQARQQLNYKPNQDTYYQNLEFKVFADDYDFSVQGWSMLVESLVNFLSSYLSRTDVHDYIKRLRNPNLNTDPNNEPAALRTRHMIIYKMFDLFSRVEFRIRDSVERGFTQLIKLEQVEKDLIPRENPEVCFKPFLCFMQQENQNADRKTYMSETSLYCFMKLLKLFKTCFNTERLLLRFRETLSLHEDSLKRAEHTLKDDETNQISRIFGILGIVLSRPPFTQESEDFIKVILQGLNLEQQLQVKGAYSFSLRNKLEDLLNAQTSLHITHVAKNNLVGENSQRYMNFFLETLKKPKSHQLRERICRENPYDHLLKITDNPLAVYKWSQIIHILIERLPWYMSQNEQLLKYYKRAVEVGIREKHWIDETEPRKYMPNSLLIPIEAQQFVLNLKILILFAENIDTGLVEEKIKLLFFLVEFCELKTTLYLNFVKMFFKHTLPKTYSPEKQKMVFLRYLSQYTDDVTKTYGLLCPNDHYFKIMNVYIMLPILSNIFEKGDLETSILFHSPVLNELDRIVRLISSPEKDKPQESYPTWWLIEYTILLDYILAKTNFRKLRYERLPESATTNDISTFLHNLTHFSWKNLVPKQETSKLLVNLSKLLVSRIKSHSDIFDRYMDFIYELYYAILNKNEDIVDEENKQIWINAVDVILPAMAEAAQNVGQGEAPVPSQNPTGGNPTQGAGPEPQKSPLPKSWCEDFIKSMETNFRDRGAPTSKDKALIATRWWSSILKNRDLIFPHRMLILEVNQMFWLIKEMMRINAWVTPVYFFDMFLVNIAWHIKDAKLASQNSGESFEQLVRVESKRDISLVKLLHENLLREDDQGHSFFRIYFLYRIYSLVFDKIKHQFDAIHTLLSSIKKRYPPEAKDEPVHKKLKTIFVYMNICLMILYHPKAHEMREQDPSILKDLFDFLMRDLSQKRQKEHLRYTYGIPLGYQIIRRIIKLSAEPKQNEYLEILKSKCIESIKIATPPNDENRPTPENPDSLSIWPALLFCRILYEMKPEILKDDQDAIAGMASMFMKQFFAKRTSKDSFPINHIGDEPVLYNENEDILDKIFFCANSDTVDAKVHIKNYHRGYTILMLRIYTKLIDKSAVALYEVNGEFNLPSPNDRERRNRFAHLIEHFLEVLKNGNVLDHELKLEALMMLRCFLIPHTVKTSVYKPLAKDKDFLSSKLKMSIVNTIKLEGLFKKADIQKPRIKIFMDHLWQLVMDIIDNQPNSKAMNKFLRRLVLVDTSGLTPYQRDTLINKVNELSQDFHYMKFNLLTHPEFAGPSSMGVKEEEAVDYIRKYCKITSSLNSKAEVALNTYFSGEMIEEQLPGTQPAAKSAHQGTLIHGGYCKNLELYKIPEMSDIDSVFGAHCRAFHKTLQEEADSQNFFRSYRHILDMEYLSDRHNTYVFWKTYIKQMWEQADLEERSKIWITLNDLTNFQRNNSENDNLFLVETLRELNPIPMLPDQLKVLTRKAVTVSPLATPALLDSYLEYFNNVPQKDWSISPELIYTTMGEVLENMKERDLLLGLRKTILESEREKNLLTLVQLRDYHTAEALCDEIIKDSPVGIPFWEPIKECMERHFIEEAFTEIKTAFNEWGALFEISKNSERRDVLLDAANFTKNFEYVDGLTRPQLDDETIYNYIYYMTANIGSSPDAVDSSQQPGGNPNALPGPQEKMIMEHRNAENKLIKQFKDTCYFMMAKEWFYLPKIFSENHVHQMGINGFWLEFEDTLDVLNDFKTKSPLDNKAHQSLVKLREDLTYHCTIIRHRLPNPADGILHCKRILDQRSTLGYVLSLRFQQYVEGLRRNNTQIASSLTPVSEQSKNASLVFNDTFYTAVMYSKIERSFGIYESIQKYGPVFEKMIEEKKVYFQTDEYLYWHEQLKFWQANSELTEPPELLTKRLISAEGFTNKDYKSDLYATMMEGYMEKGMFEKANQAGIAALKLQEENWKLWVIWFNFYNKMYIHFHNTEKGLSYLKEAIKAYTKGIKYIPTRTYLLFAEILYMFYFREDLVKSRYNTDESQRAEVVDSMEALFLNTPMWTWTPWLGNLLLNVYGKDNLKLKRLDEVICKATYTASVYYTTYVFDVLNSLMMGDMKLDTNLEEIYEKTKNCPSMSLKFQDASVNKLFELYENEKLPSKSEFTEILSSLYASSTIDTRMISRITAKCKDIGEGYQQLKNQDNAQRLIGNINDIDTYIRDERGLCGLKPTLTLEDLPLGTKFGLLNLSNSYSDNLNEFFIEAYLLPKVKVVYEARQFGLQLEFMTKKQKKLTYILTKTSVNSVHLFMYNHYLKIMNMQLKKNNETVYRGLRFEQLNMMFLEDKFCLKAKPVSEINLIDLLDREMESQGLKPDLALELFATKKAIPDVNRHMMERTNGTILKKEVLTRLRNEYDFFLWKKRYAQSLGVNMINSLLFVKDQNFERIRIVVSSADYFDDNIFFLVPSIQKNKPPSKPPLRLTQNHKNLLNDYMIEGALIPAIGSVGGALYQQDRLFNISTIMSLFLKDYNYNTSGATEENAAAFKMIESHVEGYFCALLKMTGNHDTGNSKNTRNPAFTSLRAFVDNCASEDNLRIQLLSFRSWF